MWSKCHKRGHAIFKKNRCESFWKTPLALSGCPSGCSLLIYLAANVYQHHLWRSGPMSKACWGARPAPAKRLLYIAPETLMLYICSPDPSPVSQYSSDSICKCPGSRADGESEWGRINGHADIFFVASQRPGHPGCNISQRLQQPGAGAAASGSSSDAQALTSTCRTT